MATSLFSDEQDAALRELSGLLLTASGVEDFLHDLTVVAARTLPGPVSCSITHGQEHGAVTVAGSDTFAETLDEVQYGVGEGPCLEAMRTGCEVDAPDLTDERRWADFPAYAVAQGGRATLSLPLSAYGARVGALNLHSRSAHAFQAPELRQRARELAAQASTLLAVVLRQARQTELTDQLREALYTRSVIDQAVGVLMAQQRGSASEAFALLRAASQRSNRKLRDVAGDVVTGVSGSPPQPSPFRT